MTRISLILAAVAFLATGSPWAVAGVYHWDGNGANPPSGYFYDTENWNPNGTPGSADEAWLDHAYAYGYVVQINGMPTNDRLVVTGGGQVHLFTAYDYPWVATYISNGNANIVGDAWLNVRDIQFIVTDELYVGEGAQLTLREGPMRACLAEAGSLSLGTGSSGGDAEITAGADLTVNTTARIGFGLGQPCSLTVSGDGSSLACGESLTVGGAPGNYSTLLISDSAYVSSGSGSIGKGGSQATVEGNGSSWDVSGHLEIGDGGSGALIIADSGVVSCNDAYLGRDLQSEGGVPWVGGVTISGRNSAWNVGGSLYIGHPTDDDGGYGTVTVNDGLLAVGDRLRMEGARPWNPWQTESELNINGGAVIADFVQLEAHSRLRLSGGELIAGTIDASLVPPNFEFTGGELHAGTYAEILYNDGGTLAPGLPIGTTEITWQYYQNAGTLQIEIAGAEPGEYDYVEVGGHATLGGDLEVALLDGFVPRADEEFVVLWAHTLIDGEFDNASHYVNAGNAGGFNVTYSAFGTVALDNYQTAFPYQIAQNTTTTEDWHAMGPPDDEYASVLDGQMIDCDFDHIAIIDNDGPDFNVYEYDYGILEFDRIDVQVSPDGILWTSVKDSEGPVVRIEGDEAHGDDNYARSYDLSGTPLGLARHVRIVGIAGGGFDLDSIGIINEYMWPYPQWLIGNSTGFDDTIFLGPPDNIYVGIGGQFVEYDFGELPVVDRSGPDFNVYELDNGLVDFHLIDVLVSDDAMSWVSVKGSEGPVVRIPGDEANGDDNYARSYDLAGCGLDEVRFVRIDGEGDGPAGGGNGFDLDAIGAIHTQRAWIVSGDTDRDGDVDIIDLATLLGTYGKCEGDTGYNPAADFNGDGCVNLTDLAELLGHYGR